jgi:hypothetical protein
MSVNIRTTFEPTKVITVSESEYFGLLGRGLVFAVEGQAPILRPAFSEEQAAAISTLLSAFSAEELPPLAAQAVAAAIDPALIGRNVVPGDELEEDEFEVRFDDGDPFFRANETVGIHDTLIAGNQFISTGKGWLWRIAVAAAGRVYTQIGQREDGAYYPDALNGSAPTKADVTIEGTSLVANWGSSSGALSEMLGRKIVVRGNGGQRSMFVAGLSGGEPFRITLSGNKIPASGSVASTTGFVPTEPGATATLLPSLSVAGSLAGIAGVLTFDSSGVGTFTRSLPGLSVKVPPNTPFISGESVRSAWPILWVARNNFKASGDPAQVVRDLRRILAYKTADAQAHALILTEPPWPGEYAGGQYPTIRTALDNVTTAQRDAFPTMFLDTAAMLRDADRLASVGITPTSEDLSIIAADGTPPSFQTEDGHLNAAAYQALNAIIAETYASRGWTS